MMMMMMMMASVLQNPHYVKDTAFQYSMWRQKDAKLHIMGSSLQSFDILLCINVLINIVFKEPYI